MRIDHIAYPCRDPFVTHRFYSEVMGLELVQAYAGRELLLVYALPEGGNLVFSASPGSAPPPKEMLRGIVSMWGSPWRHAPSWSNGCRS